MTSTPEWLQVAPPVVRVIAIVAAVRSMVDGGERVIRSKVDRAYQQFDSFNKYLLSIYGVRAPVLDPGGTGGRVPVLTQLMCLKEVKSVSKQRKHKDFRAW